MKPAMLVASKSYGLVQDATPFFLETDQPLLLACCDCNLVHLVHLTKVRGGIKIEMCRAERNTASMRRKKRKC